MGKITHVENKGDRSRAIIDAIRSADDFLTSQEIRKAIGLNVKANSPAYNTINSAICYLRSVGQLVGITLYKKSASSDFYLLMHLNGLPEFFVSTGKEDGFRVEYEDKLLAKIQRLGLYFEEQILMDTIN